MKKLTTEDFIKRAVATHGNEYDYSKTEYINVHTKVCITCPEHGDFWQTPTRHMYKDGCPYCAGNIKLSTEEFIKKAKEIHGNKYDYSKVLYIDNKTKVIIICPIHGKFWQRAKDHYRKKYGCPKCAKQVINNFNKSRSLSTEEFILKAKLKHGNKYDYSKVEYTNNKTKVCIICPEHGDFWQNPEKHTREQSQGCPKCSRIKNLDNLFKRLTTEEFILKAKKVHGDKYDYSKVEYGKDNDTKVCIICPIHGEFWQTPINHFKGKNCIKCSNTGPSNKEQDLVSYIESIYSGRIVTSDRSTISPLELDIFIPEYNLAIEFDGLYWHSEKFKDDNNYHLNKTNLCKEKGIRLIHIFEDEWDFKQDIVKARIQHALNTYSFRVYARECQIYEIENKECKQFLNNYHIQGNCVSSIKLGLYLGEELVAVMTFGKPRFNKDYEWELLRYCCISDHNVIGGAGKLLKAFERGWEPNNFISYCDLRWGTGGLYKQLGFEYSYNSKSTYWYFKENSSERESRIKYQKHKLHKLLDNFDESLSEHQNMINHNYLRIYDCGNMVFTKQSN